MWLLLASAFAGPVTLPELTEAETKALDAREIVVRTESESSVVAFIDIDAPPDVVLAAVLDLPARAGDIDNLDKVSLYREETDIIGAKFEASLIGFSADFHILYTVDRAENYTEYHLDESYENDISASDGAYQVYARGEHSRMMYTADISAGGTPMWIKKALVGGSMSEQLEGQRRRAETERP